MPDLAPSPSRPACPRCARCVRHAAAPASTPGCAPFSNTGTSAWREATRGAFGAQVIRAVPGSHAEPEWHTHDLAFQMVYMLKGWVRFEYEDIGAVELRPGDCVHQPPRVRHREVAHSDDLELIEITGPAEFATSLMEDPPR